MQVTLLGKYHNTHIALSDIITGDIVAGLYDMTPVGPGALLFVNS